MPVHIVTPETHSVWVYARLSDDKNNGRSIKQQVEASTDWCQRERLPITNVLRDNDRSASRYAKRKREDWELLKDGIRHGKMTIVMYWEASRATRDLMAYSELRDLCVQNGVYLAYDGNVYDMNDADDRFKTGLDILLSEKESEQTRVRVKRNVDSGAVEGRPSGRIPFGYARSYDERTKEPRQFPDPVKAELIKEAARRFLAGESTRAIAEDWNRRKVPTPYQGNGTDGTPAAYGWRLEQIKRILVNPAVNGKRVHQGKVIGEGQWDAILDDVTYVKVLARFADPSRKTTRARQSAKLLTGVARCGVCGGPIGYAPQKGAGRKVRNTYRCRYNNCTTRDMKQLDRYVTWALFERIAQGDIYDESEQESESVTATREHIAALRSQLDDAIKEFNELNISATTLGRVEGTLTEQMRQAERTLRVSNLPTVAVDLSIADDPATLWETFTVEQRRDIIKGTFEIIVHPIKARGARTFDPTCVTINRR